MQIGTCTIIQARARIKWIRQGRQRIGSARQRRCEHRDMIESFELVVCSSRAWIGEVFVELGRFWANRKSLVHVLAYYRLKLKELSEVLREGSLQDLEAFL